MSEKPSTKTILDDVFSRPEKEVTYFVGMLAANAAAEAPKDKKGKTIADKLGSEARMVAATFSTQIAGNVQIQHGWNGDDYVWHIEPVNRRKWKSSADRAIYATAKAMHGVIPDHVFVRIFRPQSDWEIKVFTFKAEGLKQCWNVSQEDLARLNLNLFKVLNALI